MNSRSTVRVADIEIATTRNKCFNDVIIAICGSDRKCSVSKSIRCIQIGTIWNKKFNNVVVAWILFIEINLWTH